MGEPISVAVLTVSDTAAIKGPEYDTSGPLLKSLIDSSAGHSFHDSLIVPDNEDAILAAVKTWVDGGVDWVITTGGTGWSPNDVTPEAVSPHLSPLPILSHHIAQFFLTKTPRSVLSRPLVGLWRHANRERRTLVLCLPGSRGACKDGWEAMTAEPMSGVLGHGFDLLRGGKGLDVHPPRESVKVNSDPGLSKQREHDCDHVRHGHRAHVRSQKIQDPSKNVSSRLRHSPYPMIPFEEALQVIDRVTKPLAIESRKVDLSLVNHVLAEDVYSSRDLPPNRTSSVDGYAVRTATTSPGVYKLSKGMKLEDGKIARINTGGSLPIGADSVVMVEDTSLINASTSGEELDIEILVQPETGDNVRQPGSDVKAGELVLKRGTVITHGGGELGAIGFVAQRSVKVYRRPVIGILSTGDELVDLHSSDTSESQKSPDGGERFCKTIDTNRMGLIALVQGLGYEAIDLGLVKDTMDDHLRAFKKGIQKTDLVLSTGGTSMGEHDLLKPMIENELGGTIHFGRVAMKPGKPTTFATVPDPSDPTNMRPKYIFGLPGNPASALVCFHLFAMPCIRGLGGFERRHLPRIMAELSERTRLGIARDEFQRVILHPQASGKFLAFTTGAQQSSRVASMAGANALLHLPSRESAGRDWIEKGEMREAVVVGELGTLFVRE